MPKQASEDATSGKSAGFKPKAAQTRSSHCRVFYLYGYDNLEEKFNELAASDSAGFIFFATEMEQNDIQLLEHFDRPHIILDSYFPKYHHNYISIANMEGAYLAARHLLEHGHRRIGYLASSIRINNFHERRAGLQMALDEYPDCTLEEIFISPTQDGAYLDMRAYLDEHTMDVTGCFADNDIIAVSCIRALLSPASMICPLPISPPPS